LRGALQVQRRRRATKPTRGSQRRRLKAKSERSEVKQQRRRPSHDD
jgi:ribosome-associated protein